MSAADLLEQPFGVLPELIAAHALERPDRPAVINPQSSLTYREFDAQIERVAAALQRDGLAVGEVAAICASASAAYASVFLGVLRAGAVVAPLAPSATPQALAGIIADCGARILFLDQEVAAALAPVADRLPLRRVALDGAPPPSASRTGWPRSAHGPGPSPSTPRRPSTSSTPPAPRARPRAAAPAPCWPASSPTSSLRSDSR